MYQNVRAGVAAAEDDENEYGQMGAPPASRGSMGSRPRAYDTDAARPVYKRRYKQNTMEPPWAVFLISPTHRHVLRGPNGGVAHRTCFVGEQTELIWPSLKRCPPCY